MPLLFLPCMELNSFSIHPSLTFLLFLPTSHCQSSLLSLYHTALLNPIRSSWSIALTCCFPHRNSWFIKHTAFPIVCFSVAHPVPPSPLLPLHLLASHYFPPYNLFPSCPPSTELFHSAPSLILPPNTSYFFHSPSTVASNVKYHGHSLE